jgi:organic hydroperoxide reductase OsmC/OhrA
MDPHKSPSRPSTLHPFELCVYRVLKRRARSYQMEISARVVNKWREHKVLLSTNGREQSLQVAPKEQGFGSSVNGGELLFLALATCYCNDLYREASKRGIELNSLEVQVIGEFGAEGAAARNIRYTASVSGSAPESELLALMRHTDSVAEIQNTLRHPARVVLTECKVRHSHT